MSGKMIFEAMTDIDDEFIEKAQNYRPHKVIPYKMISGIMAASLVLFIGIHTLTTLDKKSMNTGSCEMAFNAVADEAKDTNGMQDAMTPESENVPHNNAANLVIQGIKSDTNSIVEVESKEIVIGVIDSYTVSIKNFSAQENGTVQYQIILKDTNGEYLLEDLELDTKQKENIEKMINEYLEGLKKEK